MTAVTDPGLCRLTVLAPDGRADFAVPVDTPIFDLLPVLVRRADPDRAHAAAGRGHWVLQRMGDPPLDEEGTPRSLGLRDGEVLHLRPRTAPLPPIDFDDVIDGVRTAVEGRRDNWRPELTRRLFLALGALGLATALAGVVLHPGDVLLRCLTSGALAVALLGGAAAGSRALGDGVVGTLLGVAAVPFALVSGMLLPGAVGVTGAPAMAAGAAFATAAGIIALLATGADTPLFLGIVLTGAATAGGGLLSAVAGLTGAQAAGLVAGVAFLAGVVAPSAAARMVRIRLPQIPTGAGDLGQDVEPVPERTVLAKAARADQLLSAMFVAISVVCVGCFALLVPEPGWAPSTLVGVVSVALLLRSRVLVGAWQRISVAAGGAVGLALLVLGLVAGLAPVARMALVAALVAVAVLLLTGARRLPGRRLLPYWGRAADIAETVSAVAVVPVALAVLDVFSLVRGLAG
ncbi:type VII secretion integral membrane protein EccD [Streptoalloteichus hindustanus]|uniref:Type VII secretion integral membrane protein EccD n=1 Tax=Streptoalloteichus hindustanus TaxID=2017 RepID=A0A1M5PWW0_STRHI|nr:type VII secretion integral membrane protein EccD [Streptoalloteichus hindustanus]SHH05743.1 type VII secretion integral membrane protein EccD [Streptoalloteichus hindustanus]